jgi:hypothetical protein
MRSVCFHQTSAKRSWIVSPLTLHAAYWFPAAEAFAKYGSDSARGKSGGARIIYLFGGTSLPGFILAAFAKNEKANLSAAERNALGKMVATMVDDYRRQK